MWKALGNTKKRSTFNELWIQTIWSNNLMRHQSRGSNWRSIKFWKHEEEHFSEKLCLTLWNEKDIRWQRRYIWVCVDEVYRVIVTTEDLSHRWGQQNNANRQERRQESRSAFYLDMGKLRVQKTSARLWFLTKHLVIRQNHQLIKVRTRQNKMRKVKTKGGIMQISEKCVVDPRYVIFSSFLLFINVNCENLIHIQWSWPHDKEVSDTVWSMANVLHLNYSNYYYKLVVCVSHRQPPFS